MEGRIGKLELRCLAMFLRQMFQRGGVGKATGQGTEPGKQ